MPLHQGGHSGRAAPCLQAVGARNVRLCARVCEHGVLVYCRPVVRHCGTPGFGGWGVGGDDTGLFFYFVRGHELA